MEYRTHDTLALCVCKELALISEKSSCRDKKFKSHSASNRCHFLKLALSCTYLLHNRTYAVLRNVNNKSFDRFAKLALYLLEQNVRC